MSTAGPPHQPPQRPVRTPRRAVLGNSLGSGDGQGKAPFVPLYPDWNYTTNLCTNPSFEAGLIGWSVTDSGTTIEQCGIASSPPVNGVSLYGGNSMRVITSASVPRQGVVGPQGVCPSQVAMGSVTLSLFGETGQLTVSAVANPGGVVLASTQVILTGTNWQTVVLNNLSLPVNGFIFVVVTTSFAQAITFEIDGVMYEPESPAHAYCDGDQPGCYWTGVPWNPSKTYPLTAMVVYLGNVFTSTTALNQGNTPPSTPTNNSFWTYVSGQIPELSPSFQPYQYAISGSVGIFLAGQIGVIAAGEVFPVVADVLEFTMTPEQGALANVFQPAAALTDFGIWQTTDPDPAQTYGWWTNSGTSSGTAGYNRIYGMVTPPMDYPVSNGNYAWRHAQYAAVGFAWAAVPSAKQQVLTDVQLEYARMGAYTTPVTPTAYQRPRQLQVIIKPNRLNYITNPAFQLSTTNWTPIQGNEGISQDTSQFPPNVSTYNNLIFPVAQSCKVSLTTAVSQGAQISVPFLIPGQVYMCSVYVQSGNGLFDIIAGIDGESQDVYGVQPDVADVAGLIEPQYAYGGLGIEGYGSGPYGGVAASTTPLPTGIWTRVAFPFIATSDTGVLQVTGLPLSPFVPPVWFWLAAVMIEEGDILNPYFDGNSGVDALWETGGTPNLTRSYYYNQLQYGQAVVNQTLANNTPLGISYAPPLYATVPTQ